ncbi:hypothetical protein ACRRTK_024601 [Alexandromys fortis]
MNSFSHSVEKPPDQLALPWQFFVVGGDCLFVSFLPSSFIPPFLPPFLSSFLPLSFSLSSLPLSFEQQKGYCRFTVK